MLDCDPHLNEIKELIRELNRTNGLFKFVRDMRLKFQEAAAQGRTSLLHAEKGTPSNRGPIFYCKT